MALQRIFTIISLLLSISLMLLFGAQSLALHSDSTNILASAEEPIKPIPVPHIQHRKYQLGKSLFHEKRLHKEGKKSCSDCHNLDKGGTDGKSTAKPISLKNGGVNTPSIFNVSLNKVYYWDARFNSLDEQMDDALLELNQSWSRVVEILEKIPSYQEQFHFNYAEGITPRTVKDALLYYVRSLNTPNSSFDQYLRGNPGAMDKHQKTGYHLFKSHGCIACHQGINLGGNLSFPLSEFSLDKFSPTLGNRGGDNAHPVKNNRIRVPGLRNVELTAPYLHDGSLAKLEDAVNHLALQQMGSKIPDKEVNLIVRFLKSLTGKHNGRTL